MKVEIKGHDDDSIDLAPLLDCVFLLLIFFMVASTLKRDPEEQTERDLPITLAHSTSSHPLSTSSLLIQIDKDGFYFDQDHMPISIQQLHTTLKNLASERPDATVTLKADRDAPHHSVVQLIDSCHFTGIERLNFRVAEQNPY